MDEDMTDFQDSQRESPMVKGFCDTENRDTTSEPQRGQCSAGCARYRVNE